jgi:uncharacterized protein YjbI with pentapeptide repeats
MPIVSNTIKMAVRGAAAAGAEAGAEKAGRKAAQQAAPRMVDDTLALKVKGAIGKMNADTALPWNSRYLPDTNLAGKDLRQMQWGRAATERRPGTILHNSTLDAAKLPRAMTGVDLTGASAKRVVAPGVQFDRAKVAGTSFTDADLRKTSWTGAQPALTTSFRGADLRGAEMRGMDTSLIETGLLHLHVPSYSPTEGAHPELAKHVRNMFVGANLEGAKLPQVLQDILGR